MRFIARFTLFALLVCLGAFTSYAQNNCSPPTGVKVSNILSAKIQVAWDAGNITPDTRVQLAWAEYPTSNFVYKVFESGTSGEITGLKPNTKYTVRVSRICGTETVSTLLSLGTVRTLSIAEEQAACDPNAATDLCKILLGIETAQRSATFIDMVLPAISAEVLGPNTHLVQVRYRRVDNQNNPLENWLDYYIPFPDIPASRTIRLNGLIPNSMYQLIVVWNETSPSGAVLRTCETQLNYTPTLGDDYIGPVFSQIMPNLTVDCSAPRPLEIPFPNITGGCSDPRVTFTDGPEQGSGCNLQMVRTWIAVDDCGRSSILTQTIQFTDTQAPVFIDLPANNAIIQCNESLPDETPTAVDNCSEVTITNTETIVHTDSCNAVVTRTWVVSDACGNTASYVQTIELVETLEETNGEDDEVPPLPVNCGQVYAPVPNTNTTPLNTAQPGQTLDIGGFPALLKTVTGGNGTFNGSAKLRLPFGNKVVYVDFNNIQVNEDKKITQGTLIARADPNFEMPDPGNLNIGGEICLPDPPQLTNGFNSSGEYILQPPYEGWEPGDPIDPNYDPNGFDANGYHIQSGTQFNPAGCNQQGVDADGNPCNNNTQGPYYWLHNNNSNTPTTPEGIAYASTLETANPNIRALVEAQINVLLTENTTALSTQRTSCAAIRTDLNTKVGTLDRKFFFGTDDVFFNEDMNLQFSSKPVPLQQHVPDRSPAITGIEEKHIELYYCDKLVYKFKQTELILNDFKTQTGLDILVPNVLDAIKRLTAAQVTEFTADPNKLKAWIKEFIHGEVFKELQERGLVHHEQEITPEYLQMPVPDALDNTRFTQPQRRGSWIAGTSEDTETMRTIVAQSFEMRPEELQFEYLQGFEYVGGIHRAFYLDAIAKARDVNRSLTVEGEDPESLLPIRLQKDVGGRTYTMLLDKITVTPTGGNLDAYFILDIPNDNQKIVFKGTNIPFTPGGLTGANTRLSLQSDVGIRLNNAAKLIIKGANNNTFIEWNCSGFSSMGIEADIEFCRKYLTPLKPDLSVDPDEEKRVKAHFIATMPAWGEFIAQLSMDKFALTKHLDYKWVVEKATLDFSDVSNADGFSDITANYMSEFKQGNSFSPQWKGFFMEKLQVTLPTTFSKNSPTPITLLAEKLIIDDRGLTGLISLIAPIVPLNTGNLDGWAYSMDKITIAVVANKIQGGGFGGLLHVPIFKGQNNTSDEVTAEDCFRYEAKIISTDGGEIYEFTVQPGPDSLKLDIMVGTATLKPSSSVKVTYKDDKFTVLANLSGDVRVDGDLGEETKFKLPRLTFEGIKICNEAPYFRGGSFSLPLELGAQIGGFGLTINGPQLVNSTNPATSDFRVGAAIKLVGDGNGDNDSKLNFGASTSVIISGEMVVTNGRQRWKYKDYFVERIAINASFKGVDAIKGQIDWYKNDDTFGRGFRGQVAIQISGLKKAGGAGLGIEAVAQFGKKDDYKYFFVDALASLDPGIDIGGLAIRGFGGGVYYHMERDSTTFAGLDDAPSAFALPSGLGVSLSGIQYTPNITVGLGIKATIIVATTKEEVFNGGATFEVVFNSAQSSTGVGIREISLYGSARMMAPIQFGSSALFNSQPSEAAPIAANFAISYVFATKTLHGELAVFVNVEDAFSGAGNNYLAGKAVLHFDPDKWYINVGTPTEPVGVKINIPIGGSGIDLFTVKSYFCVGTGIPPMPPLPPYVQQMTGADNFMANESRRASGRGFAIGASVEINTGELEFLIFYGQLDIGLGFDLMLQKYDGIVCSNNNNKPLGINGWYASGQAWAYINAELGVKVGSKRYAIMDIGAAAALQAKMPNPFWARGAVGGEYRILGGIIKGNCNFKFTVGKNCETNGENTVDDVILIEELDPSDGSEFVEVQNKPTAYFGVPVNGTYTAYDDEGNELIYDVKVNYARLINVATGAMVNGQLVYSADRRQLTYKTPSFLNGNTQYRFDVSVQASTLNVTTPLRIETRSIEFTTGEEPTVIPKSNIASQYPIDGMYNLYKNEVTSGFIDLKDGQFNLLETASNLKMSFSLQNSGVVATVPVQVSSNYKKISFNLPATLQSNQIYRMDLMLQVGGITAAREGSESGPTANNPGEISSDENTFRSIYTSYFRVSTFNKFIDKITYFKNTAITSAQSGQMLLTANIEPFDALELFGTGTVLPLIPIVEGNSEHTNNVKNYYMALREMDFFKPYGNSNLPVGYMQSTINGTDTLLRISSDLYHSGAQGMSTATVVLKNKIFSMAKSDFIGWALKKKEQIQYECDHMGNYEPTTDDCYDDVIHNFPPFVPPAGGHCCESMTLTDILFYYGPNGNVIRDLYEVLGNIAPEANSTHPFTFGYRLPQGQLNSNGTTINFKY